MVLPEAEVAHGLADYYISFDSQDNQRPESNFTYTREREGWGHRDFEQQEEKNALMAAQGLLRLLFLRKTPGSR